MDVSPKDNKTPGPNGYSPEFYKKFAPLLIPPLTAACNAILDADVVPRSWNSASIVVIPKPGQEHTSPASYIPISLLNQDYKIFTALLAWRLKTIFLDYVHWDQTVFRLGRDITDNILKTLNLISSCAAMKIEASLLSVNIEKEFDTLETSYLCAFLKHMNFSDRFLRVVQSIYATPFACVHINGLKLDYFALHRGIRQGCPLSPLHFAIALKPLAAEICHNPQIKGVQIGIQG